MAQDPHGRDRIFKNSIVSWLSQGIQIIAGFILPRLIDESVGKDGLGVWDFAWSLVAYFNIVTGGIISSINRYIAKARISENKNDLHYCISTIAYVLRVMGGAIFLSTILFYLLPIDIKLGRSDEMIQLIKNLVLILGTGICVQVMASVYSGVLTGYHRWDIYNLIQIVVAFISLVFSTVTLLCGGGLVMLALVQLGAELIGRLMQIIAAKKIFPSLTISRKYFKLSTAKSMLKFGGKTYVNVIAYLIANQTVNILIGALLGPAVLALYSRPRALIRRIGSVVRKYAMLLVPTVSSLQMSKDNEGIMEIAVNSTQIAIMLSLPPIMLFGMFGGDILQLWMGSDYNNARLAAVVAFGGFFEIAYMPLYRTLMGMNMHGRLVRINLISAIATGISAYIAITATDDIVMVAIFISLPMFISQGIAIPIVCARALEIQICKFFAKAWIKPLFAVCPFLASIIIVRIVYHGTPLERLAIASILGGLILSISTWKIILPKTAKNKIQNKFFKILRIEHT